MAVTVELSYPAAGVGLVSFSNPPKNFIAGDLGDRLEEAVGKAKEAGCAVVVLASTLPGYFIAHAGLARMAQGVRSGARPTAEAAHAGAFFRLMRELERGPMVSIAAVRGQAWGGGAELCWSCNLRVAAESATFGQPETLLGIIPGAGGTTRLARLVGPAHCMEMVLDGGPIDARTALAWGAVNRVAPDERLLDEALRLAARLATRPAWALASAKRSVLEGLELPLDAAMRNEFTLYAESSLQPGTLPLLEAAEAHYDAGRNSYIALGLPPPELLSS